MRSEKKRIGGAPLIALGLVLILCGTALVLGLPDELQYALPAPQGEGALKALYQEGMEQLREMSELLPTSAICARLQGASLSTDGGRNSAATLYAVGEGYFDVRHETLLEGRFITGTDVRRAEPVIVISEDAAVSLFPGSDPLGQKVKLMGNAYEVAGVFRGGRRIGETDSQLAYIPITTADARGLSMQTVELVALGTDGIGPAILMENTLRTWKAGGSFYSLAKLKLGAAMPLRWLLLIVGAMLLLALLRRLNARVWARICHFVEALRTTYAIKLLPAMLASGFAALLGYALWGVCVFLLARFSIEPLLVFTEWVPEVVVELSSLVSRFWSLNTGASAAVQCATRASCVSELGGALILWGLSAALLGEAVRGLPWLNRRMQWAQLNRDR